MRKYLNQLLLSLAVLFWGAGVCLAVPVIVQAPFQIVSGPSSVTCSSSTWTSLAPSTAGTFGTFIKNLDANSSNVEIIASTSSSAPAVSTSTVQQWNATPSGNAVFIGNQGKASFLWCVGASTTGGVSVTVTEVKPTSYTFP